MEQLPSVTVLIPMRNEEGFIEPCLDSILANDYPREKREILVIDGMSSDKSRDIVDEYAVEHPSIRLLDNPERIVSTAMNIGIREASGEVIVWMNAHTTYDPSYIRESVTLLQGTEADHVGGRRIPVGNSLMGQAIALAMSSPFGIGDARYHYGTEDEWVDTVFAGTWYKRTLTELGGFNEDWVVNQDYELNYRLRQNGGRILFSPSIRCWYQVRPSLRALIRQYFRYGFWKVKTLNAHPESLRWRQLIPPLFVLALLMSILSLPLLGVLGLAVPLVYLAANGGLSLALAWRHGWRFAGLLPVVFAAFHLSWGIGFWVGLTRFGMPNFSWRIFRQAFQRSTARRSS